MDQILEALNNIGFNWKVALANFVNFLIIFYILKRFAWKPIREKIDERNREIEKGLKNAEEAEKKLSNAREEYEEIILKAKKDAHKVIAVAEEEKEKIISLATDKAEKKAEEIVKQAEDRMNSEMNKMKKDFQKYAAEISVMGAKKIIKES